MRGDKPSGRFIVSQEIMPLHIRGGKPIGVAIARREKLDDSNIVMARATTPDDRTDVSSVAVAISVLKDNELANVLMNAEEER